MTRLSTLDGVDLRGKRVLLRADLNLPMQGGRITDATRLERLLPTLQMLGARGARTILVSHLGRPKGDVIPSLSLAPVADALSQALGGRPATFVPECVGSAAELASAVLEAGNLLVLENLRFHAAEEANGTSFARKLALLADLYVNDAFSCAHRAHASTVGVTRFLPAYAGPQFAAEIEALERALKTPARPVAAVVGGAKVSTKLDVLKNLVHRVDLLVIGGGMANTFLHAQGVAVGSSLYEPSLADTARAILTEAKAAGCQILLPRDAVVAHRFEVGAVTRTVPIEAVPEDQMILDVGPLSRSTIVERLSACRTLLWNGPLGAFEVPPFDAGTRVLAEIVARLTREGRMISVAGGGDTVAALNAAGKARDVTYLSTAGGAFLEWLEGKTLPGVAVLESHPEQAVTTQTVEV